MKRTQYILHLCVVLFLLCLVAATAVFPRLVGAQQTNPPVLRVTGVDVDNYPDVRAYVYGQNLGKEFADVPLFVKQDGVDQVATGSDIVNVGTQVVFLIDSSEDIFKPGKTEIPRYQEVIDAVTRVTRSGVFDPGSDLMTGFAPAPGETIESIIDWTKDHGDVYNHFYQYMPEHGIGQTPLNKLIYYGLDSFSSPQLDERAQRAMVLFSDGVDNLSPEWIDTATSRAQDMNVAIYTVLLGDGTRASRSNLERIAVTTGGQFIQLTSEGALDAMFKHIAQGSQQRSIDYRSTS
ncbi:MAG: VWA domain-containing protein, partial [Anaerolineae bacterium]|nr:VWA domain-containing protein [Anaerolineae bacterium]